MRCGKAGCGRLRWTVAVGALGLAVVIGLAGVALLAVRSEFAAAHDGLRRGASELLTGDPSVAKAAFLGADRRAQAAGAHLDAWPVRVAALLPVARPQLMTTRALADAAGGAARAGGEISSAVVDLDGGLAAIAPRDGRVPIEPLRALQPSVRRAAALVDQAATVTQRADHRWLLPPLRDARTAMLSELESTGRTLTAGVALVDALPAFLGEHGTRRYLFGASTPAELRGTGGLIGAYAVMSVQDGLITFGDFVPASGLPDAVDDPPPAPGEDYQHRYGEFAAAGHWSNINMTPDFPTAAVAIERLYARAVGDQVDGVIVADPFALRLLLQATGPVEVPGVGVLHADNVVDFLTHDSYTQISDPTDRKAVLGSAAVRVFEAFLRGDVAPRRKGRRLADAVGGGHVLVHAKDPEVQAAFLRAEAAGQLLEPDGDFLAVMGNNAAGNKIDYFAERTLDHDVQLRPDGTAHSRLRVGIANNASASGLPAYVIGPADDRFEAGENVTLMSVYCSGCRLDRFQRDGRPDAIAQQEELGRRVLPATLRVPAGGTRTLTYELRGSRGWELDGDGGVYRLTVQGQPTVRQTDFSLRVRVPQGMSVVAAPDGAVVENGQVIWTGPLVDVLRFEIALAGRASPWQRAVSALAERLR